MKYFIQYTLADKDWTYDFNAFFDNEISIATPFGYKPGIRSYTVRIVFLQFILQTNGSDEFKFLNENTGIMVILFMCLAKNHADLLNDEKKQRDPGILKQGVCLLSSNIRCYVVQMCSA